MKQRVARGAAATAGIALAILVGASGTAAAQTGAVRLDELVAAVGPRVLLGSDVRLARDLGLVPPALDDGQTIVRLVDRTLMLVEVERFQPPAAPTARIDDRVAELRRAVGEGAWESALRRNGVDEAHVRAVVAQELRLDAYLRQRFGALAEPSDDDLREASARRSQAQASQGMARPEDEARLRRDLTAARMDALVAAWVTELRQRGDVSMRTGPTSGRP